MSSREVVSSDEGEASEGATSRRIPLRNRHGEIVAWVLCDPEDFEWLMQWRWSLDYRGYAIRGEERAGKQRTVRMHVQIMGDSPKPGLEIDHRNRCGLDNRRKNLRWGTRGDNLRNRGCTRVKHAQSGVPGVRWDAQQGRWAAFVKIDGRWSRRGSYDSLEEAIQAQADAT